jgi:L-aspartate oxidase
MEIRSDFLVIGSGIAGLSFALKVAAHGRVALVSKVQASESSSFYAQGGIASVLSEEDSFDLHVQDTLVAGAGLCREDVVRRVVSQGPARIAELVRRGVQFTERHVAGYDGFDLGREGGHSKRRIIHAEDLTGRAVELALLDAVKREKRIRLYEYHQAINLISLRKAAGAGTEECLGAYVLDGRTGEIHTFLAAVTLLATGGAGKVYRYTSNPDTATGDGVAMAYRMGAAIGNMEFIQFHPTCLYHPKAKNFLISEAVRGEGGRLLDAEGRPFMKRYDRRAELAPRDIVARAIYDEMKRSGAEHVYLDVSHKRPTEVLHRFPNLYLKCRDFGFDMTREPLPVVPAAHYTCGGIVVDGAGRSTIRRLYAIGEVSCTGLHGANRLASNSLLEALVYAHEAARAAVRDARVPVAAKVRPWDPGRAAVPDEAILVTHNWDEIRATMHGYVGIVRSTKRLERARARIELIAKEIAQYYWDFRITGDLVELRNLALVAELIVRSAMARKESRGLHYTLDHPRANARLRSDTVLVRERKNG